METCISLQILKTNDKWDSVDPIDGIKDVSIIDGKLYVNGPARNIYDFDINDIKRAFIAEISLERTDEYYFGEVIQEIEEIYLVCNE